MPNWDKKQIDWYVENFGEDISNSWVIEAAELLDHEDVLDIGCGSGAALRLAERISKGRLVGVDPFEHMIFHAKAATEKSSSIEYFIAQAERLPFSGAQFDVVCMINVIHHLDDATKGLAEVARVLRPQGRLLIGGEKFDSDMLIEGQDYQELLLGLGFKDIATLTLGNGAGFATIARFLPEMGSRDV